MTMSAIANSNQNRNVSVYVSCSNKMKSKQKGIGMYTKTCKICNWHLLPSFHYFATSNAGYTKDSNNKMALICVGETISGINGHHVYNYKVGENLICVGGHTYETVKIRLL